MDSNNKGKTILNGSGGEKDHVSDKFPAGMRVLIVDDDRTCLMVLEKMLKDCQYAVTACQRALDALSMLREDKNRFDIVLSDAHMPNIDGLQLLEIIRLEMDLPVVMMSSNDGIEVAMRGIVHGACDYLVKPVRMDAIKILWQHVIRKRGWNGMKEIGQLVSVEDGVVQVKQPVDEDHMSAKSNRNGKSSKRRKENDDEGKASGEASSKRKQRVVWTTELHQKFVKAVNQLGRDKAVPQKLFELMQGMNVTGITRENISSHLQKYRLYLQRLCESPQEAEQRFMGSKKSVFEKVSLLEVRNLQPSGETRKLIFEQCSSPDGFNSQACATSSQPPLQCLTILPAGGYERQSANFSLGIPLVDKRNLFDTKIPESSSYPMTINKLSKPALPLSRINSGESVFTPYSGRLDRLNANSSLGMPLVELMNHFDPKIPESSPYPVNELPPTLALPLWRTNSGESVFGKIVSSGGLERLDVDSSLSLPLIDRTNCVDPKMPESSSYLVNELPMLALPPWRTDSVESIFGKTVSSGGLGRLNAESSLGSSLLDLTNLLDTECPESSSYAVTEQSTFSASLPHSRASFGSSVCNTSSGEGYTYRNLGTIAQLSRNLSIDDANVLKDESLLNSKNFDLGDFLRKPFT